MIHRTIEQELAQNGRAVIQTVGVSMEPLLHNRKSTVALIAKQGRLQKQDVALYRRPATGAYVLHRVVKVLDDAYLICGDNRTWRETVPDEWVIGVMTGYYEKEQDKYISCESTPYQSYLKTLRLRYAVLWLRALPGQVWRRARWALHWERSKLG